MAKKTVNKSVVKKPQGRPRVLVAPLDWGLGHATRCIPVIYELIRQGAEVFLAGEGMQERILREEFPDLPFLSLAGYRVKYARSGRNLWKKIAWQLPRLLLAARREKKWLEDMIARHHLDAVISDNRFGLAHPSVPCVYITHQLQIKTGLGKRMDRLARAQHYRYIRRFFQCWVPDFEVSPSLAGELSHPDGLPPVPACYCGPLSRLAHCKTDISKNHLFVSISGPEPQRTIWENKIVQEIAHYAGTATVVRGLPQAATLIPSTNDIRFFNHLATEEYSREMARADLIISRSGYSTVMDIARLKKRSLLVPTPGQPEQEYLGHYLSSAGFAPFLSQGAFSLKQALKAAEDFQYGDLPSTEDSGLQQLVSALLTKAVASQASLG